VTDEPVVAVSFPTVKETVCAETGAVPSSRPRRSVRMAVSVFIGGVLFVEEKDIDTEVKKSKVKPPSRPVVDGTGSGRRGETAGYFTSVILPLSVSVPDAIFAITR
jgi:hypothetical protein